MGDLASGPRGATRSNDGGERPALPEGAVLVEAGSDGTNLLHAGGQVVWVSGDGVRAWVRP